MRHPLKPLFNVNIFLENDKVTTSYVSKKRVRDDNNIVVDTLLENEKCFVKGITLNKVFDIYSK